jgi:hypothetical protein
LAWPLAELQSAAGAVDDALASIKQGLELAERTGGHPMDARLHRLRGDILAKRDPAAAETAYSLRIAREQGARTFELQATPSLAKLYQSMRRAAAPTPSSRQRSKVFAEAGISRN